MRAKQSLGLGGLRDWRRDVGPFVVATRSPLKPSLRFGPVQRDTPAAPLGPPLQHSPPGLLYSLISPGTAAQRGWGRAGVPQDSWLTGPLWDSGLDPGVQEAVDTGAVTVGPQIPHPVAPALVSGWGEGGGGAPGASQGWVLSWGREGDALNVPLVGC